MAGLSGVAAVSAGEYHTCALLTGGRVSCWGSIIPKSDGGFIQQSLTPVAVTDPSGATTISAGWSHTCALLDGGRVSCWGWNNGGQLGDGSTADSLTPVEVLGIGAER